MFRERQLAAQIQQISEQRSDIDKVMKEKKRLKEEREKKTEEDDSDNDVSDDETEYTGEEQKEMDLYPQVPLSVLADVSLRYDIAVYPTYARKLQKKVVECKDDCCVSSVWIIHVVLVYEK